MAKLVDVFLHDIELQQEVKKMFAEITKIQSDGLSKMIKRQTVIMIFVSVVCVVLVIGLFWVATKPAREIQIVLTTVQEERRMLQNDREANRQQLDSLRREKDSVRVLYYRDSLLKVYNDSILFTKLLNENSLRKR